MPHLWSKPGSLVTAFSTSHPGISLVNLIKKHCLPLQVIRGSCFSRGLKCSALQVPIFYKINIDKRPQDHARFFIFYFTCLWVKPFNSFNLSSKKTFCLIWRYKQQRIFPFPQQCCTPGWKIRISDISDLTYQTFCLAEGKYLSALKQEFFYMLEWKMMGAFKHVIVQALCAPSHTQTHPWGIQDTHGGASWVFCHIHLRQGCDTWEPGLKWTWGHQASDLWQLHPALSSSWWFNSFLTHLTHFDKPKHSLSIGLLSKTEICELKDTKKMLIFLDTVFPTAKKKLSEWWFIPNWL